MTRYDRFTPLSTRLAALPDNPDQTTKATTVGQTFYVEANSQLVGMWHYRPVAETTTPVGGVWRFNDNTTPIATVTFATSNVVGWQYKALDTPVDLDPQRFYVVGVYSSGKYACWGATIPNASTRANYWGTYGIVNSAGGITGTLGPGVKGAANGPLGCLGNADTPSPASGPSANIGATGAIVWGGSTGLKYPAIPSTSSANFVALGDLYGSDVSIETVSTSTTTPAYGGPAASFVEAFDGPLDARWDLIAGPSMPVPSGGAVAIPSGTTIATKQGYDLADSQVIVKLPAATFTSSDTGYATLQIGGDPVTFQLYTGWNASTGYQMIGLARFHYGNRIAPYTGRYSSSNLYFKLRESDGLMIVETAPAAAGPWTTRAVYEHNLRPMQLRARKIVLTVSGTRAAGPVTFSELNVTPVDETVPVPNPSTMAWMHADPTTLGTRWTGAGVKCAVVDQGTTAAVRARIGVTLVDRKVINGAANPATDDWHPWRKPAEVMLYTNDKGNPEAHHGCLVAPCLAPAGAQLVDVLIADATAAAPFASMTAGLKYAGDSGAKVINLSFGDVAGSSGGSQLLVDTFNYLATKNCLIFISSGNDAAASNYPGGISYPARYAQQYGFIHAVGAAYQDTNVRAVFSNYGPGLTGLAPGAGIAGLTPTGKRRSWDGTSGASPDAGHCAILLLTDGIFTPAQVGAALKATLTPLSGVPTIEQGGGAYNFQAAVNLLAGDPNWPSPDGPTRGFVDAFTTAPAPPTWSVVGAVTAAGGVVSLASDSSIRTAYNGNLKDSSVIVEAVDVAPQAGAQAQVRLGRDPSNWIIAYTGKTSGGLDGITIGVYRAGQFYFLGYQLYDPTAMRWWRIFESGGYIVLETSPDATATDPAWTTQISFTHELTDRALGAMPITLACAGTRSSPAKFAHLNTAADPIYTGLIPTARTRAWMGDTLPLDDTVWHGRDVTVAVIDEGTTAATRARQGLTLVARKEFAGNRAADGVEIYPNQDHGCSTSGCAVPQGGRIVDAVVSDAQGALYVSTLAAAMRWSADRAKVINFSIGGEFNHPAWGPALSYVADRGAQIFISAGNDNQAKLSYPAAYSTVLSNVHSVGAFDEVTGKRAVFSNHTASMSGVAPGVAVAGMLANAHSVTVPGTSFSAPLTARLCAKLLTGGRFTPAQAGVALDRTARDTGQPRIDQGGGAFDLSAAIAQIGNPIGVGLLPSFALPRFHNDQWADVAETFNAIPAAIESLGRNVTLRYGTNGSYATLGPGIVAAVPWQIADSDSRGSMWSPTIPELVYAREDGRYTITVQMRFPNVLHDATVVAGVAPYNQGRRIGAICLNGYDLSGNIVAIDDKPAVSDLWGVTISLVADIPMLAGDYVTALITHTAPGTLECLLQGWGGSSMGVTRTGPIGVDTVSDVA